MGRCPCALAVVVTRFARSCVSRAQKNHPDPRNEQALLLALFLVARFTPDELTRVGLW